MEAASVPVDDAQPRCAISGEKFEVFWHDQHQVWYGCTDTVVHVMTCPAHALIQPCQWLDKHHMLIISTMVLL